MVTHGEPTGLQLGNGPHMEFLVLSGCDRWEAGRNVGGMDKERRGWARLGEEGAAATGTRAIVVGDPPPKASTHLP